MQRKPLLTNSIVGSDRPWAKQILDLYEQGASDVEVAAANKWTIKDYYRQINENVPFGQLVEFGRTLSQAFWEGQARKNLSNKAFNTSLWSFYMKNKYGWADKTEAVGPDGSTNQDLDALRANVMKEAEKLLKRHTPELTDAARVLTSKVDSIE